MSSALPFQDDQTALSQLQQEPHSLAQGKYPDQRSTQHSTRNKDRDHESNDEESLEYPNFHPPSPNKQQTSPLTAIP